MRAVARCVEIFETRLSLAVAPHTAEDESETRARDMGLLARMGGGDPDAMTELYDRYAPTVYALGLRMLRDAQTAEDIVQETFWRVWKTADRYDEGRGAPGAWIYGIGRNVAIDWLRRRQSRPDGPPDEARDVPAAGGTAGEDTAGAALSQLRGERVRAALDALSPVQREVIELAYFGGLTRREIAERTGAPLGTVHTRARLALQKLGAALSGPATSQEGGDAI